MRGPFFYRGQEPRRNSAAAERAPQRMHDGSRSRAPASRYMRCGTCAVVALPAPARVYFGVACARRNSRVGNGFGDKEVRISTPRIIGIVNLNDDSFFDGGKFTQPDDAFRHAVSLADNGAYAVELGPASSHPDAPTVSASAEIARLEPLLSKLRKTGLRVGVDSFHTETQRFALRNGASMLNDTQGFSDREMYPELADSDCLLVIMHSVQRSGHAARTATEADAVLTSMYDFFERRVGELEASGIARERMVLDPGMGFFLGEGAEASLLVLSKLDRLLDAFAIPTLVSVSNKSFLGTLTGRNVGERGPATLAAELYAVDKRAAYIRTHDVAALTDALTVRRALGDDR